MTDRRLWRSLVEGSCGGAASVVVGFPFDLAKTRMQALAGRGTMMDCLQRIIATDGVRGLYRGISAPLLGATCTFGATFWGLAVGKSIVHTTTGTPRSQQLGVVGLAAAGSFSALPAIAVLCPAERVKIMMQVRRGERASIYKVASEMIRTEGIRSFYQGAGILAMRDAPGNCVYFTTYYNVSRLAGDTLGCFTPVMAGSCSGVAFWCAVCPLDAIKTKVQANVGGLSVYTAASMILDERGWRGFYRGLMPACMRAIPGSAALFSAAELSHQVLDVVAG